MERPTRNGVTGLQGHMFQLATTLHFLLRSKSLNKRSHKFAIEILEGQRFDDLAVKIQVGQRNEWLLLQAKHSLHRALILQGAFVTWDYKSDFAFPKYFYSAMKTLNVTKCPVLNFVLHTNDTPDAGLLTYLTPDIDSQSPLHDFLQEGDGKIFKFSVLTEELKQGLKVACNRYLVSQIIWKINKTYDHLIANQETIKLVESVLSSDSMSFDEFQNLFKTFVDRKEIEANELIYTIQEVFQKEMGIVPAAPIDSLAHFEKFLVSFRLSCEFFGLENLKKQNCRIIERVWTNFRHYTKHGHTCSEHLHSVLMAQLVSWWHAQPCLAPCQLIDVEWIDKQANNFIKAANLVTNWRQSGE